MATITAHVDVDIDEFDDAEIVMAAKERGYRIILSKEQIDNFHKWDRDKIAKLEIEEAEDRLADDDLADILQCLRERRYDDAIVLVEAMRFPKFKTITECMEKYAKTKQVNP